MKKILLSVLFLMSVVFTKNSVAINTDSSTTAGAVVTESSIDRPSSGADECNDEDWVPMIAYVMPIVTFSFITLIILIVLIFNLKSKRERNALYLKHLELGKEIPEELLNPKTKITDLKKGVVLAALGIGICLFLITQDQSNLWTLGLIPLITGAGFLVLHLINSASGKDNA